MARETYRHGHSSQPAPQPDTNPPSLLIQLRVRVGLAEAHCALARYASLAARAPHGRHSTSGDWLRLHSHARIWQGHVLAWTVAAERILEGTPWDDIAQHLGLDEDDARNRWGRFVEQVERGDEHPTWLPHAPGVHVIANQQVTVPTGEAELRALAERHRQSCSFGHH